MSNHILIMSLFLSCFASTCFAANNASAKPYVSSENFEINIPNIFSKWTHYSEGFGGTRYPHFYNLKQPEEGSLTIYSDRKGSCDPVFFGVENPVEQSENQFWGNVGIWEYVGPGDRGTLNLIVECWGYAFCAQRDDQIITMCLSQETDNQDLAQQIFSSFRWLKKSDVFHDIPEDHPQATAISFVKENGIVAGYPDGTYRPDAPINRAEFTKIIMEASSGDNVSFDDDQDDIVTPCFPDVPNDAWFAKYVCSAKEEGIIAGHPDGTFHPADNVNAAEAAKIISEGLGLDLATAKVNDKWYQAYWNTLLSYDAIPVSVTGPSHLLTRGEMAEIINSILSNSM